jgi:hypothetical protein
VRCGWQALDMDQSYLDADASFDLVYRSKRVAPYHARRFPPC